MVIILGFVKIGTIGRNGHIKLDFTTKKWTVDSPWPKILDFADEGTFELKDNGDLWIWEQKPGKDKRNTLVLKGAPTGDADAAHTEGRATIEMYRGFEFPWIVQVASPAPQPGAVKATLPNGVLPVGRFSPAPGIFIDRTGTSVKITGRMELFGPEATAARAQSIEHSINQTWNHIFEDGYSVSCNITVRYRGSDSKAGDATQIEAANIAGPSHVTNSLIFDRCMTLNAGETDAFSWTPTHEFGHILGLQDRYSEGIMSKVKGKFGGTRSTTIDDPRYQSNLMAIDQGRIESLNVKDLAEENAPSPYWVNDDVQVRNWVGAHSRIEIGMLTTANKLKLIRTLMTGWVSDEDMDAIVRICDSVTSESEADTIRDNIDPLDLTSIGQRMSLRHAFRGMPGGVYAGQGVR